MKIKINKLEIKKDSRGSLIEVFKPEYLGKNHIKGQFFVTTANPGMEKGKHYHKRKKEWFCVIKGEGELYLENIKTHESSIIKMGEKNMITVEITPYTYHSIKNIGNEEMILLVYSSKPFNPSDPDTFSKSEI